MKIDITLTIVDNNGTTHTFRRNTLENTNWKPEYFLNAAMNDFKELIAEKVAQ